MVRPITRRRFRRRPVRRTSAGAVWVILVLLTVGILSGIFHWGSEREVVRGSAGATAIASKAPALRKPDLALGQDVLGGAQGPILRDQEPAREDSRLSATAEFLPAVQRGASTANAEEISDSGSQNRILSRDLPADAVPSSAPPELWMEASGAVTHEFKASGHKVEEFSFEIPSPMSHYEKLRCDVVYPVGKNGRVLTSAADVVALFPYPTQKSAVEGLARPLAAQYGFTIFTVRFPEMWPNADIDPADRTVFYYYPESGSGQAWVSAYDTIVERLGIPRRKWFCFGRSGGASAAHLFAESHPYIVDAYAQEAGRIFNKRLAFNGPILSISGENDYVKPATDRFVATLQASTLDPFVLTFRPNWGGRANGNPIFRHSMPNEYADVVWRWFAGLADIRVQAGGAIPPRSQWLMVNDARVPGSAFAEAAARLPSATRVVAFDGRDYNYSEPRPGARKQRIFLWSRSNITLAEDLLLNGQYLADNGHEVLGLHELDARPLTIPRRVDARTGLWIVEVAILEEPTEGDLRTLRAIQPRPNLLILIRASSGVLQEWERIGWKGAKVLVFSRSSDVGQAGVEVRPLPSKVKGPGDWHVQVMKSIVSWLNAQKGERRP